MPLLTFIFWLFIVWSLGWLALPLASRVWRSSPKSKVQKPKSKARSPKPKIQSPEPEEQSPQPLLPDAGIAAGRLLLLVLWTLGAFWLGYLGVAVRFSALLIYPVALFLLWRWRREREAMKSLITRQRRGIIVGEA